MKSNIGMWSIAVTLFIGLIVGTFIGFALLNFYFIGPHEIQTTEFKPVSYTDFVTILLSVITVLLAIMGIFFALLAVFSYSTITNRAVDKSVSASETIISTAFKPEGTIHNIIITRLRSDKEFRASLFENMTREFIQSISNDEEGTLEQNDRADSEGDSD